MRNVLLLIGLIILGCSKHKDPVFTSAEGRWTFTTPDSKIGVTFDLVKNGSGLDIQSQLIKIGEDSYQSAGQITGVSLPAIQMIRINANDSKAVVNYNIEFDNCTVSNDFKIISVATATYTWPWGRTNTLTGTKISR